VLSRTGHIGLLTRPEEFAELVRRFADETCDSSTGELQRSGQC
jgi:hypothetical protein